MDCELCCHWLTLYLIKNMESAKNKDIDDDRPKFSDIAVQNDNSKKILHTNSSMLIEDEKEDFKYIEKTQHWESGTNENEMSSITETNEMSNSNIRDIIDENNNIMLTLSVNENNNSNQSNHSNHSADNSNTIVSIDENKSDKHSHHSMFSLLEMT